MKLTKTFTLAALSVAILAASSAPAHAGRDREKGDFSKMLHKLGRGVTNVVTCWVEVPRTIAREWEATDPATGFILGTVKGVGWTFARFATGAYETFTFPLPVPADYGVMMEPEFIVTDVWGEELPELTDMDSNDPFASEGRKTYPQRFRF